VNAPLPAAAAWRPSLREQLAVRVARARRWEFWPAWLWYAPVVAYIVGRGLRASHPTAFTAANPAMAAGGVVGESKVEVLAPLAANCPDLVAEFELLPAASSAATRLQAVRAFAERHGWPLVLKPDIGQRGRAVAIVRSLPQARDYLRAAAPGDVLVQRYIGGAEFGVFVYRDPRSGQAEVLSVTSKNFPAVTGDGRRNLGELIRDDARARLIAPLLWQRFAADLARVPAAGEPVTLVEIGAHCRGALFLDARQLISPALRQFAARVFEGLPGYHFGRLDLRCPSPEALRAGRDLRLLEINGVTAEAAHIYHPDTPLLEGYRSMFRQWQLAFEIGEANLRQGAQVTGPLQLLRRFRADLRRGKDWELGR